MITERLHTTTLFCLMVLCAAGSGADAPAKGPAKKETPQIEVCFVLDTTGSMSSLIEGAKRKIWSIANDVAGAKPTPEVKFGLIGYRDRKDAYITKVYDLTDDIDSIHDKLTEFRAQGGGDTPESVNQALNEAVTKMSWDKDPKALKIVFLVGDAPPHMDYKDDVKYQETCLAAVKQDLIINTVQCGGNRDTAKVWQDVANRSEGSYVAISQGGGMTVAATPMDDEMSKLSAELAATRVGYGDARFAYKAKAAKARTLAASAAPTGADRAEYMLKKDEAEESADFETDAPARERLGRRAKDGKADLLVAIEHKALDLGDLEEEKLPEEMRKLDPKEREAYVAERIAKRKELQQKLSELSKKRSVYIEAERKKLAASGKKDGFDEEVGKMIREQAAKKGIEY